MFHLHMAGMLMEQQQRGRWGHMQEKVFFENPKGFLLLLLIIIIIT
jgi:hypothetical protein